MWWLDHRFNRGIAGSQRRLVYQTGSIVPAGAPSTRRPRRQLQLTEAEKAANLRLLEFEPPEDPDKKQWQADIAALEQAIRDQKAHHQEVEAEYKKSVQDSFAQLSASFAEEREALSSQLEEVQREARENQRRLAEVLQQNAALREMLVAAENHAADRRQQLDHLQAEVDQENQRLTASLAEAEDQFSAESKHLQALAASAQERSESRLRKIQTLRGDLQQQEASHQERTRKLTASYEARIQQATSELYAAHYKINALSSEVADQRHQLEYLQESIQRGEQQHTALAEQAKADAAALSERAGERRKQTEEISHLKQQLSDAEQQLRVAAVRTGDLQTQVRRLEQEQAVLKTTSTAFQQQLDAKSVELNQSRQEHDEARASLKAATVQTEHLQQQVINLQVQVAHQQDLQAALDAADKREQELAGRLTHLETEISQRHDWEEKWKAAQQRERELNAELEELKTQVAQKQELEQQARKRENELVEQISAQKAQLEAESKASAESNAMSDRERSAREQRIVELQHALQHQHDVCAELQHESRELQKAADRERMVREQRIVELQQSLQHERSQREELNDTAGDQLRQSQERAAEMKRLLERQQDAALEESKKQRLIVSELHERADSMRRQCEKLRSEFSALQTLRNEEVGVLTDKLGERQRELDALWSEHQRAENEVDKQRGALERVKLQNERLLEVQGAQFASLQARIDELVESLDAEQSERKKVAEEARRLSTDRSQRITFLSRQRQQFVAEVYRLRSEEVRLNAQQEEVRQALADSEAKLHQLHQRLEQKSTELEDTRVQLQSKRDEAKQTSAEHAKEVAAAQDEIHHLRDAIAKAETKLQEQAKKWQSVSRKASKGDFEFAIVQRDRTIAVLEQEAVLMQERLQREAAARRKAESLVKQKVRTGTLDPAAKGTWSEMDRQDQIERLHRQINALRNINLLERQRAAAEVARYKKKLEVIEQSQRRVA